MKGYIIAYSGTLFIILGYSFLDTNYHIWADAGAEYARYLRLIEQGWEYKGLLIDASIITTYIPALIARILPIAPLLVLKIYNALLIALLPIGIYRLSRIYKLNIVLSVIAALLIVVQFNYVRGPIFARTIVASLFWCLLLIGLRGKGKWSMSTIIASSILMIFTHYTTAFLGLFVLSVSCVLQRRKPVIIAVLSLMAGIGLWYGYYIKAPLDIAARVAGNIMANGPFNYHEASWMMGRIDWSEPAQIIAFVGTLLALAVCILGIFTSRQNYIAVAGLMPIMLYYIYPSLCLYYDYHRLMYFTLVTLSPCFAYGVGWLKKKNVSLAWYAGGMILLGYVLSDIAQAVVIVMLCISSTGVWLLHKAVRAYNTPFYQNNPLA